MRSWLFNLAAVAGLIIPALYILTAWLLAGSAVRTMLAVTLAALLNLPSPMGGGMLAQGVLRVRWMQWEWTFDADRSRREQGAGAFLLSAATTGGFFATAPIIAALLRWLGPFRTGLDELLVLGAAALLIAAGLKLHRPEASLRALRSGLEAPGAKVGREELARLMKTLSGLERSDGSFGHIGGIGARTVGLHEHLEAEALLRLAAGHGTPEAARLHSRSLDYLLSCAEPTGGFSTYPSGMPRVEYTARALEALGGRLDEASLQLHHAALLSCRRESGQFGRSATAPASSEATEWARRALGTRVER